MAEVSRHLTVIHAALERASREAESESLREIANERAQVAKLIMEDEASEAVRDRVQRLVTAELAKSIEKNAEDGRWDQVVELGVQAISSVPGDSLVALSRPHRITVEGALEGDDGWEPGDPVPPPPEEAV